MADGQRDFCGLAARGRGAVAGGSSWATPGASQRLAPRPFSGTLPARVLALLLGPPDVATPVLSWHRVFLILSLTRHLVVRHLLNTRGGADTGDAEMGNPSAVPTPRMHGLEGAQADREMLLPRVG